MIKATLEEVLRYRNEEVIRRFLQTWDMPRAEAEDLFDETKKWLWLNAYLTKPGERPPGLAITYPLRLLDEMWHTFILDTYEYTQFCERYFGYFLHHQPTTQEEIDTLDATRQRDPDELRTETAAEFRKQYELIYDHLGPETLAKWYSDYLERYTDKYLESAWRWSFSPHDATAPMRLRLTPPRKEPEDIGMHWAHLS